MKQIAVFQFFYQQQYQQIVVRSIIQWKFPNKSATFPWSHFHDFGKRKEKYCLFFQFEGEWLKHFDHTIPNESILMNPNAPREMFEYKRGHVEIGPSGQKLLYCPYEGCDKVLTSSPGLRYHMRTHSANDRPFHCNRCKKTFKRQVLIGLRLSVYFWLRDVSMVFAVTCMLVIKNWSIEKEIFRSYRATAVTLLDYTHVYFHLLCLLVVAMGIMK